MDNNSDPGSLLRQVKAGVILFLLLLVLIFALQNSETVSLAFLIWELSLPRVLIFFIFFAVGFLCGITISNWKTLVRNKKHDL